MRLLPHNEDADIEDERTTTQSLIAAMDGGLQILTKGDAFMVKVAFRKSE